MIDDRTAGIDCKQYQLACLFNEDCFVYQCHSCRERTLQFVVRRLITQSNEVIVYDAGSRNHRTLQQMYSLASFYFIRMWFDCIYRDCIRRAQPWDILVHLPQMTNSIPRPYFSLIKVQGVRIGLTLKMTVIVCNNTKCFAILALNIKWERAMIVGFSFSANGKTKRTAHY